MRSFILKLITLLMIIHTVVCSTSSNVAAAASAVPMKFYSPLLYKVGSNEVIVALFGKTTPGSRVSFDRGLVVQIEPAEGGESAMKPKVYSTTSDSQGYFRLGVTLPMGVLQATLVAEDPRGNSTPFVIDLRLGSDEATLEATLENDEPRIAEWRGQLKDKTSSKSSEAAVAGTKPQSGNSSLAARTQSSAHPGRISLGIGGSYQSFAQTAPDVTIKFDQFNVPSLEASLSYTTPHWMAWLGAASIQGTGAVIVGNQETSKEKYNWQWGELGAGVALVPKNLPKNFGLYLTVAGSLQSQPVFVSANGQDYRLETASLTLGALGLLSTVRFSDQSLVDFGIRYLHPVSSSLSGGSLTPEMAIEGRLAYSYTLKNKPLVLGWSWRVLSHKYKYDLGSLPNGQAFVGARNLLHSNLVFSLGYAFH